jgi:glutamyl-tRNA synthetase
VVAAGAAYATTNGGGGADPSAAAANRISACVKRTGGTLYQPLRVALTGSTRSPGIFDTVALLAGEEAVRRIDATLAHVLGDADAEARLPGP